jgi:hypothetical protein
MASSHNEIDPESETTSPPVLIDISSNLIVRAQLELLVGQLNTLDQVVTSVANALMAELNLTGAEIFNHLIHNRMIWLILILNIMKELPNSLPYVHADNSNQELKQSKDQMLEGEYSSISGFPRT